MVQDQGSGVGRSVSADHFLDGNPGIFARCGPSHDRHNDRVVSPPLLGAEGRALQGSCHSSTPCRTATLRPSFLDVQSHAPVFPAVLLQTEAISARDLHSNQTITRQGSQRTAILDV
jgi:hypothetical protein